MPAVTSRIDGTPTRRIAELLAMPTTDGSCCVPSPQSPISDPVAGRSAEGMRFCVRALHALVGCSSGLRRSREFDRWRLPEMRPEQPPRWRRFRCERHSSSFSLLSLGHSLGAFPAPGGSARLCFTDCGALFFKSGKLVAPQSVPYGFRFPENLLCKDRKKHFPDPPKKTPLGTWERGTSRRFAQECPE